MTIISTLLHFEAPRNWSRSVNRPVTDGCVGCNFNFHRLVQISQFLFLEKMSMDTLCEAFQSLRLKDSAIFNWETEQLTCTKTKFDKNFISQYEEKEISFIKELLPETFYSVWVIRPKGEIIDQGIYPFLISTVSGALKSNISVQTYLTIKKTTQIAEITMTKEVARLQLLG